MAGAEGEFYTPKILDAQLTGMIKTKEPGFFSARLRIPAGVVTSEVLERLAEASRKYGRGELYLTARLGFEIPGIPADSFPALREDLGSFGVSLAGCGPRMRSTTACKGTVCPHASLDTFAFAREIDRRHNDPEPLPHKFKVGVAGCASSCSKPQLNDVGLAGVSEPRLDAARCIRCGICKEACHLSAVELVEGLPDLKRDRCVTCGDCVKACPAGAMVAVRTGVDLYVGGRWGREKQVGAKLASFLDEEEALGVVGRIKRWYVQHGQRKERLGQTLLRLGLRRFQADVLEGIEGSRWVELTPEAEARFQPSR